MKKLLYLFIIISTTLTCISCSKLANTSMKKDCSIHADTIPLIELERRYETSKNIVDLRNYLHKIDITLAKDNNILTCNNINLAKLKLSLLNFNNSDSTNISLSDSLSQKILCFYKKMITSYPNSPHTYIELGQMYFSPQSNNIDSANYYFEKALSLCDSILIEKPYNEDIYILKIHTMLIQDRETEVKAIIKRDEKLMEDNPKISRYLQQISNELGI